jgi:SAM-dependent methyltransferase
MSSDRQAEAMALLRRTARPVRGPIGRIIRLPARGLEGLIHAVKNELVGYLEVSETRLVKLEDTVTFGQESLADQVALQAAALQKLQAELDRTAQAIERLSADASAAVTEASKELAERIAAIAPSVRLQELTGGQLADLDGPACTFLNWVQAHNGPLAEAGLWLNHPTVLEWDAGNVTLNAVNERIVEQPFVFAALGGLPTGARVLDIGGGESTVAFSLASLGYDVTVIEPQGYPFQHPCLTVSTRPLEEFTVDAPFDAVVLLSAIEHFGIGHYAGGPEPSLDADVEAVALVAGLLAPGGRLVLTTPYGPAAINDLERTYDRAGIERLLDGWELEAVTVARRTDRRTWELEASELIDPPGDGRVVMVVATPSSTATSSTETSGTETSSTDSDQ